MPSCTSCDRYLEPLRVQKKCPVCKGQKGSGKCFHLSCYDQGWDKCQESAGAFVRSYCGSHPFFGGFSDRKFGDPGAVPLWEEGLSGGDSGYLVARVSATQTLLLLWHGFDSHAPWRCLRALCATRVPRWTGRPIQCLPPVTL